MSTGLSTEPPYSSTLASVLEYFRLRTAVLHALYSSKSGKKRKKLQPFDYNFFNFRRDYWTRTSDLAPPRRVRYQLR